MAAIVTKSWLVPYTDCLIIGFKIKHSVTGFPLKIRRAKKFLMSSRHVPLQAKYVSCVSPNMDGIPHRQNRYMHYQT